MQTVARESVAREFQEGIAYTEVSQTDVEWWIGRFHRRVRQIFDGSSHTFVCEDTGERIVFDMDLVTINGKPISVTRALDLAEMGIFPYGFVTKTLPLAKTYRLVRPMTIRVAWGGLLRKVTLLQGARCERLSYGLFRVVPSLYSTNVDDLAMFDRWMYRAVFDRLTKNYGVIVGDDAVEEVGNIEMCYTRGFGD